MKTAAVIGANGFLGSCLVKKLISEDLNIIAVYNVNSDNILPNVKAIYKEEFLKTTYDINFIYFLSGNYANSHKDLIEINYDLQRYISKYPNIKFVYISSTNVYGFHSEDITENSTFNNPSLYARFKLAGEFLITSLSNYSIIRLTYLYGPGIKNASFLPTIIRSAKENSQIILNGNGSRFQDYLYIDDAVDLCYLVAKVQDNRIYLGATGIKTSNIEVASIISSITNCDIKYLGEERAQSFSFNPNETFTLLKWKPRIQFNIGIKKMLG
jgi:nucleoside-diphosphate-sugar epimerase